MAIRTQQSISGFIATDPQLTGRTPWIGPGRVRVRSMGADRSVGHRAEVAQG